jgi:2-keto-4-pentenoate hydratase/2-oxohepta-3-ene-1,7-dioic acid hydratase in catechol pathway
VEVGDPYPLKMELSVAGGARQRGDTSDYIFRIPQILEHLSRGITFEPGDLLSLGSLGGLPGFEFGSETRKLKHGEVIEGTIERIGKLMVPVQAEA